MTFGCAALGKWLAVIDTQASGAEMDSITRLLFAVIGLTSVLLGTAHSADARKQKRGSSGNASGSGGKPVHLVVRSSAEIKQTFTYSPYPAVPDELEGYAGSQVGGYRHLPPDR